VSGLGWIAVCAGLWAITSEDPMCERTFVHPDGGLRVEVEAWCYPPDCYYEATLVRHGVFRSRLPLGLEADDHCERLEVIWHEDTPELRLR
jgi:hypothetical protein